MKLADARGLIHTLCHPGGSFSFIDPSLIRVDEGSELGDGSFCATFACQMSMAEAASSASSAAASKMIHVCARVVKTDTPREVFDEFKQNVNIPGVSVAVYGISFFKSKVLAAQNKAKAAAAAATTAKSKSAKSAAESQEDASYRVCMLMQRCYGGCLMNYLANVQLNLPQTIKLAEQVADHLCALKKNRIVWRDLKAQNMLVVTPTTNTTNNSQTTPARVSTAPRVVLSDWGTSVVVPAEGSRRMTINPIGTPGYLAPETGRVNTYDYSVDMFAWLLFAAALCVSHAERANLEDAVACLQLETKFSSPAKLEKKLKDTLHKFSEHVIADLQPLWVLLVGERPADGKSAAAAAAAASASTANACPWVDAVHRWTCEEACARLSALRAATCLGSASTEKAVPVLGSSIGGNVSASGRYSRMGFNQLTPLHTLEERRESEEHELKEAAMEMQQQQQQQQPPPAQRQQQQQQQQQQARKPLGTLSTSSVRMNANGANRQPAKTTHKKVHKPVDPPERRVTRSMVGPHADLYGQLI